MQDAGCRIQDVSVYHGSCIRKHQHPLIRVHPCKSAAKWSLSFYEKIPITVNVYGKILHSTAPTINILHSSYLSDLLHVTFF